ncbi:hypothetical protein RHSIM_Rhsim04G0065000 [Rhododendron simsii]|uniref:Uncharacterized protein n=1 Tax=Rhododendron simsii TaxID=118357 RepID=A0A834H3D2_RHOSS|nr:hypothetical protein RHSIM_Rhsim04G0065000 [Rhododendron simsii]
MLPNSKGAKHKDDRATILKNAGLSKYLGNKITCSSLETEIRITEMGNLWCFKKLLGKHRVYATTESFLPFDQPVRLVLAFLEQN